MTATEGMTHDYDDHSQYQRAVADTAGALIAESAGAIALNPGDAFVVADYGSSTGANSIKAVRTAIECARTDDPDRPVVAIHNDLRTNDWNQLFRNLTALPDSYLALAGPPVLPLRRRCRSSFPPRPRARSTSACRSQRRTGSTANSRLQRCTKGFYFCEATGKADNWLAQQADADWTAFLEARASDLATGGRLLVQMVGSASATDGADGDNNETEDGGDRRKLLRAMAEVTTGMANNGIVDQDGRPVRAPRVRADGRRRAAPTPRADSPCTTRSP